MSTKRETAQVDLIINGQSANASLRDLEAAARKVKAELKGMTGDNPDLEKTAQNYARIKQEIDELGIKTNITKKSFNDTIAIIGTTRNSYNGLGQSINQLSREMPAFANSAQTGFMAISNNIPMLVDEINKLRDANKNLAAEGQPTKSILQQLASALFSWQTLISVGVTLLTVYGAEIAKWVIGLTKGKEAIDINTESIKAMNKAFDEGSIKKAATEYNELLQNIRLAKDGFISKEKTLNVYNNTIGKTIGAATSLNEAENLMIKQGPNYIKMMFLKTTAQIAFNEASQKQLDASKAALKSTEEYYTTYDKIMNVFLPDFTGGTFRKAEAAKKQEIKQAQDASKQLLEIAGDFQKQAAEISKKNNFDFFGGNTNAVDKKAKEIAAELKRIEKERIAEIERQYKIEENLIDEKIKYASDAAKKEFEELKRSNAEKWKEIQDFYKKEEQATLDLAIETAKTDEERYQAEKDRLKTMYMDKMALVKEGSAQHKLLEAQLSNDLDAIEKARIQKQLGYVHQAVDTSLTILTAVYNLQMQQEQAKLKQLQLNDKAERDSLKDKLEHNEITRQEYDSKILLLDEKRDKEQRRIAKAQAQLQRDQAIFSLTIKAAMAWVDVWFGDLTKLPGAIAATAELGILSAMPIPEFFDGGFTGSGGNLDNRGGFSAILHPNEYVVNERALQNPMVQDMVRAIESGQINNSVSNQTVTNNNNLTDPRLVEILTKLHQDGVQGIWDFDYDKKTRDRIKVNESRRKL